MLEIKKPLKRSMSGLEIEAQLMNKKGYIVNDADIIIKECKKIDKKFPVVKELCKCTVEFCSFPSVKVQNTTMDILNKFLTVLEVAEKNNIVVYPLSLYPGKFNPIVRKSRWYNMHGMLFGKRETKLAGKTTGFHYHYTLPRGVFDKKKKFLKPLITSKIKKTMIDSYNMAIAMDPAIITLFQSSPLLDGKFVAKDTRVLIQRTGRSFPFEGGYHRHPKYAGLPVYKDTLADLIYTIKKRHENLRKIFEESDLDPNLVSKYGNMLKYSWHSVRINQLGTLEHRTMDMNHPKYVIAGVIMLKYIHRRIQQEFLDVIPSDIGIDEPFKVEGNVIYIPPHTHVRKKLQCLSAYEGFENKEIREFTRRFFRFAKSCIPKEYDKAIKPFANMINRNRSVSDVLLRKFKKKGYSREDEVPNEVCAKVALSSSRQLYKEIEKTKKTIEGLD